MDNCFYRFPLFISIWSHFFTHREEGTFQNAFSIHWLLELIHEYFHPDRLWEQGWDEHFPYQFPISQINEYAMNHEYKQQFIKNQREHTDGVIQIKFSSSFTETFPPEEVVNPLW